MPEVMETNGFYGNLETLTNKMAGMLLNNEDFCKYISYDNDDPKKGKKIKSPLELLNKRFFLQPKPGGLHTEEGVIVEMIFGGDTPDTRNSGYFTSYVITFNVICHLDTWAIKNGIRPYRILNIIDSTFNNKLIPEISMHKIIPLGSKQRQFADEWYGYSIAYRLIWNGNGC